jgi:hypothetical protein
VSDWSNYQGQRSNSSKMAEIMQLEAELQRFQEKGVIGPGLREFYDMFAQTSPNQQVQAPEFSKYMQGQIQQLNQNVVPYETPHPKPWGAEYFKHHINRLFPKND